MNHTEHAKRVSEYHNAIVAMANDLLDLQDTVQFVERWAVHHGTKGTISAEEILSAIQHYPGIKAVTKSYEDGVVPDTFDPYARIAELEKIEARYNKIIHCVSAVGQGGKAEFILAGLVPPENVMRGSVVEHFVKVLDEAIKVEGEE